jgi:hypothetical protein
MLIDQARYPANSKLSLTDLPRDNATDLLLSNGWSSQEAARFFQAVDEFKPELDQRRPLSPRPKPAGVSDMGTSPDVFKDVPRTHWSYSAIQKLQANGSLIGYPANFFQGKRILTRYEFAVALLRPTMSNGRPVVSAWQANEPSFEDALFREGWTYDEGHVAIRLFEEYEKELFALGGSLQRRKNP